MAVEWDHVGKEPLIKLMTSNGYRVFGEIDTMTARDIYFARN